MLWKSIAFWKWPPRVVDYFACIDFLFYYRWRSEKYRHIDFHVSKRDCDASDVGGYLYNRNTDPWTLFLVKYVSRFAAPASTEQENGGRAERGWPRQNLPQYFEFANKWRLASSDLPNTDKQGKSTLTILSFVCFCSFRKTCRIRMCWVNGQFIFFLSGFVHQQLKCLFQCYKCSHFHRPIINQEPPEDRVEAFVCVAI